jgi:VIT1/CCC1 family predicted Fe2+/Mn2+ transporter
MDRLSIIISLMSGAAITGALAITAFSLGYYEWWAVLLSAFLGFAMAWPSGYYISRLIKRNDPQWDRTPRDAKGTMHEV